MAYPSLVQSTKKLHVSSRNFSWIREIFLSFPSSVMAKPSVKNSHNLYIHEVCKLWNRQKCETVVQGVPLTRASGQI